MVGNAYIGNARVNLSQPVVENVSDLIKSGTTLLENIWNTRPIVPTGLADLKRSIHFEGIIHQKHLPKFGVYLRDLENAADITRAQDAPLHEPKFSQGSGMRLIAGHHRAVAVRELVTAAKDNLKDILRRQKQKGANVEALKAEREDCEAYIDRVSWWTVELYDLGKSLLQKSACDEAHVARRHPPWPAGHKCGS